MYGLVNKAIKDLVVNNFGADKWIEICRLSNFSDEDFIAMSPYPDQLTYSLVGSASKVLGVDANIILEKFGEHWILYTASEGYGDLMNLSGSTYEEFLTNMDMLHNRLSGVMPSLTPPKFTTRNITTNSLELEYWSNREGLVPMVLGMLRGLGKRFNKDCTVEHIQEKQSPDQCHVFRVIWK